MGSRKQSEKPPVHPGTILRDGYMKERGITIKEMGEALEISRNQMSCIVNGRKGISTKTAVKLAEVTGTTPTLWLNLQNKYDVWCQRKAMPQKIMLRLSKFHKKFEQRPAS